MKEHEQKAQLLGIKAIKENLNPQETQDGIMRIMEEYGHALSGEVQQAFVQGLVAAARGNKKE